MKKYHGFHLMEVLITLAIICLLVAISLPIYSQYVVKTRRAEATTALTKLALTMEQFHLENNTWENVTLPRLHSPENIAKNQYKLVIQLANKHDYRLAAIPRGAQDDNDSLCGTLTINSKEKREITGKGKVSDCW